MKEAAKLAVQALQAVEWSGDTGIWSPTCYWCGGYKRAPAMDQDYHGKAGHKPDCLRQRAIAGLERTAERCSLMTDPLSPLKVQRDEDGGANGLPDVVSGNPAVPRRPPVRIQRKRTRGWRMPEGAVYVGRPTKWGNPFHVVDVVEVLGEREARADVVRAYRRWLDTDEAYIQLVHPTDIRNQLRGKDLACWCRLDQPCHADVLLEIAND